MIDQYKLVPVEPTPEMLKAADCMIDCDPIWMARAYRAMLAAAPEAPQPAIPPGWAEAYAAFKGAFDMPLARRRDSSEYAQEARRLLREFNDAMHAAPEEPQPAIPPGYKLVPIQKLTANTSGVRIWS